MGARGAWTLALAIASLAAAGGETSPAAAQPADGATTIEGHVLEVRGEDVTVDLAAKRGASDGDRLELWRPVKLRHPVTQKLIEDRFRIGTLQVVQVQQHLGLARLDGKAMRPPLVGDVVLLRVAKPAPTPAPSDEPPVTPATDVAPPAPATAATVEVQPSDADARAVIELFDEITGEDLATRVARYDEFLAKHPNSRFADELRAQRAYVLALDRPEASFSALFERPPEALAGIPFDLAIHVRGPARGAVLHARSAGEVAYQTTPFTPAGPGYFSVTLPGRRLVPGRLEYFVEAVAPDGLVTGVAGSATRPLRLTVNPVPGVTPPPDHDAALTLASDYADYNRLRGNDRTWQTEGSFTMRFRDVGIRSVSSGFGVFRGVGGSLEELDELDRAPRAVGLTYGWLETEFGLSKVAALIPRAVVGLAADGVTGGAQFLIRLGNDRETNLLIGGEVLGGVGLRGITQLELATLPSVPIVIRTEVTNQPAGTREDLDSVVPREGNAAEDTALERSEVGVRAIFQPGYRLTPKLTVALRLSYQGRTINHSGPGLGGAVSYRW